MAFHIMDDFELTFPFEDMAQFEDLETNEKLHVIPEYLRDSVFECHRQSHRGASQRHERGADRLHVHEYFEAARCRLVLLPRGAGAYVMNFLNPFFLIGASVLALPVLIHLVRRERSEIVPFSSLMFLLKMPKRMIRQQMLKNLLLMVLRLLLIALLVGVFARPYLVQGTSPDAPLLGQGRGYVMLLDNSYSMQYGQNFEKMKSEAISRINAMGGSDRMAIVGFNDSATVLANITPDKGRLRAAVDALEPSSFGTRYFDAFSVADRLLSTIRQRGTAFDPHFRLSAHGLEPVEPGERDRARRESRAGFCRCHGLHQYRDRQCECRLDFICADLCRPHRRQNPQLPPGQGRVGAGGPAD